MEIQDAAYELLEEVWIGTSAEEGFANANVAILLGGFPRLPGMERKELITKNAEGMRDQARALDACADRDVKVLVVANPANTNALVAIKSAPSIPAQNFTALTRLDQERLRGFIVAKVTQTGCLLLLLPSTPLPSPHPLTLFLSLSMLQKKLLETISKYVQVMSVKSPFLGIIVPHKFLTLEPQLSW